MFDVWGAAVGRIWWWGFQNQLVGFPYQLVFVIGDIVTDGDENYKVTGIPMFSPMPKRANDEVDVILSAENADALIGKTLIAV